MSGSQARQPSYAPRYNLRPRSAGGLENQLPSLQLHQSQTTNQGEVPFLSPYSTAVQPLDPHSSDAHHDNTSAHSPHRGFQHRENFNNSVGNNQGYGSPITDSSMAMGMLPPPEHIKQSTFSALAEYQADLAAVNGIVISSKRPLGEMPLKPSGTPLNINPGSHSCPLCGASYAKKNEVATHFVACVGRNGNPDGACWDDGLNINGQAATAPQQANQATGQQNVPQSSQRPQTERMREMSERLNAVNGVVSPSQLAPGQLPIVVRSHANASTPLPFSCPLCQGPYARRNHVKSHFPACVDRNGNPDGLRWDD